MTGNLGQVTSVSEYEAIKDQLSPEARQAVKEAMARPGGLYTIFLTESGGLDRQTSSIHEGSYEGRVQVVSGMIDYQTDAQSPMEFTISPHAARLQASKDYPVDAGQSRIRFSTNQSEGELSGTVRLNGQRIGEINVQPTDSNPTDTDAVFFDPAEFGVGYHDLTVDGESAGGVEIVSSDGVPDSQYLQDPDPEQWEEDSPKVDPSNYSLIVNADNESGIAFAPSVVRGGRTADPDGTEIELPDGKTATVYPRQEADEAIRETGTGDLIDSPVGSGGVEGGAGSDGNTFSTESIGTGSAVVAVLALIVAARRYA
jgi:hypothetical protein